MVQRFVAPSIPPLENGDRLNREEFERRYNAMPENVKAELINGIVYMASPVRVLQHGDPHGDLLAWFGQYRLFTPGVRSPIASTIRFDDTNEPQPDAVLMIDPDKGGQAEYDKFGYLTQAPELVAEISASTTSYDLHAKRDLYLQFRVREYLVWRVLDNAIDWFIRRGDRFELIDEVDGIRESEIFPGLWLDSAALIASDLPAMFRVIQLGVASTEHAAFLKRLGASA